MKGLTKFKSQAAAAVLGSSFTRSNFQSEGVSCHPGVLALWPKITLRMKEKGCRDISYDACVTSNPNMKHVEVRSCIFNSKVSDLYPFLLEGGQLCNLGADFLAPNPEMALL